MLSSSMESATLSLLLTFYSVLKPINILSVDLFKVFLCFAIRNVPGFKAVVVLEEL
jgi:hypothetical protein